MISVISDRPGLKPFLTSFYECNYALLFSSFVTVISQIGRDRYLSKHKRYFTKIMRLGRLLTLLILSCLPLM